MAWILCEHAGLLRLDANAVQAPLESSKSDELGGSLHKLRPDPHADGDALHYEQDCNRAESLNLLHWQKHCDVTVNHGDSATESEKQ